MTSCPEIEYQFISITRLNCSITTLVRSCLGHFIYFGLWRTPYAVFRTPLCHFVEPTFDATMDVDFSFIKQRTVFFTITTHTG
jgi:hypothetical protein